MTGKQFTISWWRMLVMLLAVALLPAACHPDIAFNENSLRPDPGAGEFADGNLHLYFSSEAGRASVELNATGEWTASFVNLRAADWCSISTRQGKRGKATIEVTVRANDEYDQRSASINFVCGDVVRTIIVDQKQKDALLVTSNRIDSGRDGGRVTVTVRSNITFDCSVAEGSREWISRVGTKALKTSEIMFDIAANDNVEKREGEILFTSGGIREVVKVYQEGAVPALVVSSSVEELTAGAAGFAVEVQSNLDVAVSIPDGGDWLHEVETKALSTNTYHFAADRNEERYARMAKIVFRNAQWKMSDTVTVLQGFQPIVKAGTDTLYAPSAGGTVSFEVASPDDGYFMEYGETWLQNGGRQDGRQPGVLSVNVGPVGKEGSYRTADVYVYYKDFAKPDTVRIYQFGKSSAFSYTVNGLLARLPRVEEQGQAGFVSWGDGTTDTWRPGLEHSYSSGGPHTVTVEIKNKGQVVFGMPEDGMTVDLKELRKGK